MNTLFPLEDIVAKDEAYAIVFDEVFANGEGLCESIRRWLFGIREAHSIVGAVT